MAQFPKSSESGDGSVYGVEGDGRERAKMGVAVGQVWQRRFRFEVRVVRGVRSARGGRA